MKTVPELIERVAHRYTRDKVRTVIQEGSLQAIVAQEVHAALAAALDAALDAERDETLGRARYQRARGSLLRNGFRTVRIPSFLGRLILRRPLARPRPLHSPLLYALKSAGHLGTSLLAVRSWLRGLSTRAVASELRSLTGASLSPGDVSSLAQALGPTVEAWEQRPLPPNIAYLFLDALYLPVRRRRAHATQALLVALGMTTDGKRLILAFHLGDREAEDTWDALLADLLARGLARDALRLVISDDHKAIRAAVAKRLAVPHQLCVVHKLRNVRLRVASPDRKAFLADFKAIFWADSKETAYQAAGRLESAWKSFYPAAVRRTLADLDAFLRFLDCPSEHWTILRSTNLIERFIRELRRRLDSAGAIQSEGELARLAWAVSQGQEERWTKRPYRSRPSLKLEAAA